MLEEHDGFLTAEQIYDRMHKVEKVSLSTVYRILTVFFENGIVSKSVRSDGMRISGLKMRNISICWFVCPVKKLLR